MKLDQSATAVGRLPSGGRPRSHRHDDADISHILPTWSQVISGGIVFGNERTYYILEAIRVWIWV